MTIPKPIVIAVTKDKGVVDAALLMAVVEVETNGAPFYPSGYPTMAC